MMGSFTAPLRGGRLCRALIQSPRCCLSLLLDLQVFGLTHDPFIVWTSNMAAILSMRGLYAFVSTILAKLRFLDKSVAAALAWIGVKMFLDFFGVDVSIGFSLGVVVASLSIGVGASLYWPNPTDEDDNEASKL